MSATTPSGPLRMYDSDNPDAPRDVPMDTAEIFAEWLDRRLAAKYWNTLQHHWEDLPS